MDAEDERGQKARLQRQRRKGSHAARQQSRFPQLHGGWTFGVSMKVRHDWWMHGVTPVGREGRCSVSSLLVGWQGSARPYALEKPAYWPAGPIVIRTEQKPQLRERLTGCGTPYSL